MIDKVEQVTYYMRHFSLIHHFLYVFIALFPIVNPIAMSFIFLNMTEQATIAERKKLALLIACYSTLLLLGALLIGPYLLILCGLQPADIRVAGGLVLFSIAWKMLTQPRYLESKSVPSQDRTGDDVMSLAFFPLTMPITAGAGSIAIVIALATQAKNQAHMLNQYIAIALAIIAISALVYICYRYATGIFNTLGKTGSKVVSSLSAFILLAIGVSIIWSGIELFIDTL